MENSRSGKSLKSYVGDRGYGWVDPGTLILPHRLQLTSHDSGLLLHGSESLTGLFISAAQREPLQDGRAESQEADYGEGYSRANQPLRYPYKRESLGITGAARLGYTALEASGLIAPAIGLVHGLLRPFFP
jgi:hypothetical protein